MIFIYCSCHNLKYYCHNLKYYHFLSSMRAIYNNYCFSFYFLRGTRAISTTFVLSRISFNCFQKSSTYYIFSERHLVISFVYSSRFSIYLQFFFFQTKSDQMTSCRTTLFFVCFQTSLYRTSCSSCNRLHRIFNSSQLMSFTSASSASSILCLYFQSSSLLLLYVQIRAIRLWFNAQDSIF